MKVTVQRSGGFAGLRRVWTAEVTGEQEQRWRRLVDACPWEEPGAGEDEPDRYVYVIEAAQRRITLSERSLTDPWKQLVEETQQADADRRGAQGP